MSALDAEFERARDDQRRFEEAGGDLADPAGPLFQWLALREVEKFRPDFEAGNSIALFAAIRKCACHGIAMPDWVAAGFIRGFDRVLRCEVGSWDLAFGAPYGTHKKAQLVGMKRRRNIMLDAYFAVLKMREQGHSIDVTTFRIVAEKLGSNAAEVGRLYGFVKRMYKRNYQNEARS